MKWTREEEDQICEGVNEIYFGEYFEQFKDAEFPWMEVPWDAVWLLAEVELKFGRALTVDERELMSITADICFSDFVEGSKVK